jgi:hypothetical protein
LSRTGNAGLTAAVGAVEGSRLVRVLAVAHRLGMAKLQVQGARKRLILALLHHSAEVVGDGAIVLRGMFVCLDRERKPGGVADAVVGGHFLQQRRVVGGIDHDRYAGVILGRGAHHRGAADVDIFDGILEAAIRVGYGLLKRVEVNDHQVDWRDRVLSHHLVIDAAPPENAAVHLWMQGFDATRHHFRKSGVIGNFGDRDARIGDQLRGAASRQQFDAIVVESLSQFDDAGFI